MNFMDPLLKYVEQNAVTWGAHGLDHLLRVWRIAKKIGKSEGANLKILKAMALLHDIIRPEDLNEVYHSKSSANLSKKILKDFGYSEKEINEVIKGILSHSIHTSSESIPKSIEAKILFDSDKIEAVGPIGISRWFFTTAKKNISLMSAATIYLQTISDYKRKNKKLYTALGNKIIKKKLNFSMNFMKELISELKE